MRSPAIVFSVVAVSALSPSVLGSPLPAGHSFAPTTVEHRRSTTMAARGLGFLNDIFPRAAATSKPKVASIAGIDVGWVSVDRCSFYPCLLLGVEQGSSGRKMMPLSVCREFRLRFHDTRANNIHSYEKRLDDNQTTGGNAHTGTSGAVDGGSVDSGDNGGMPTIMNVDSNNAGTGGESTTGCAAGGKGATGGNASSGDSGNATGGRVRGSGGMINMDSSEYYRNDIIVRWLI
jgi:hypothetical protein